MQAVALAMIATGAVIIAVFIVIALYVARPSHALPDEVAEQIRALECVRPNQHLVDLELADGTVVHRVYVAWGRYPAMSWKTLFRRYRPGDVVAARAPSKNS